MELIIKFSFIALCFIIALISGRFCHSKKDWAFLVVGMGFTLISDYFLILARNYPVGVFTFCFVHIAYIMRVSTNRERSLMFIVSAFGSGVLFYALFSFISIFDTLVFIASVYAMLFVLDLIWHVKFCKHGGIHGLPKINRWIMLVGMILFALCDVNVLLFNLPNHIPLFSTEIANRSQNLIWIFYLPSQLLLSLSAVRWKK